jgi:hypothetical protein
MEGSGAQEREVGNPLTRAGGRCGLVPLRDPWETPPTRFKPGVHLSRVQDREAEWGSSGSAPGREEDRRRSECSTVQAQGERGHGTGFPWNPGAGGQGTGNREGRHFHPWNRMGVDTRTTGKRDLGDHGGFACQPCLQGRTGHLWRRRKGSSRCRIDFGHDPTTTGGPPGGLGTAVDGTPGTRKMTMGETGRVASHDPDPDQQRHEAKPERQDGGMRTHG